jgi:CRISPR-associated protein Csd2
MTILQNRYDFALLFDVKDGNPNGDPDAGNLPRIDAETGRGLVTDVCLKRKIRNYVALKDQYKSPNNIYVREKAVLGRAHVEAFGALGIGLGEELRVDLIKSEAAELESFTLPAGLTVEVDEDGTGKLIFAADLEKSEITQWLKDAKKDKLCPDSLLNKIAGGLKQVKARRPDSGEVEKGRQWMCQHYFDIRTFGAVMSLKSAPNCGQVRGPVQLTFGRSIDPIVALEHSITRMAVATEAEAAKQQGDNRTMGRKFTVPYGLYLAHGFISAHLAEQTGFTEADLQVLWEALLNMFDHDRSAARGEMSSRGLYVFKHESKLGNAPAHSLLSRIVARRKDETAVPRSFEDYLVEVNQENMPPGTSLLNLSN